MNQQILDKIKQLPKDRQAPFLARIEAIEGYEQALEALDKDLDSEDYDIHKEYYNKKRLQPIIDDLNEELVAVKREADTSITQLHETLTFQDKQSKASLRKESKALHDKVKTRATKKSVSKVKKQHAKLSRSVVQQDIKFESVDRQLQELKVNLQDFLPRTERPKETVVVGGNNVTVTTIQEPNRIVYRVNADVDMKIKAVGGGGAAAILRTDLLENGLLDDLYVNITGDTMTGTLNINVPTTTQEALILKTTDDNTTKNLFEVQDSAGSKLLSIPAAGNKITTPTTSLTLEETGDTFGTVSMELRNRTGTAGALFVNSGLDLVDFQFEGNSGDQMTLRSEFRNTEFNNTNTEEFQIGLIPLTTDTNRFAFFGNKVNGIQNPTGFGKVFTDRSSSTTPGATVAIIPNTAATIPLITKGAVSQTANLTEWQNSSGTVVADMDVEGYLTLGLDSDSPGSGPTPVGDRLLVQTKTTAVEPLRAAFIGANYGGSSSSSFTIVGLNAFAYKTGTGALTGTGKIKGLVGGRYAARNRNSSGTIDQGVGVQGYAENETGSGTITHAIGFHAEGNEANSGTLTNSYGVKIDDSQSGSGTVTNNYGLFVEDINNGATLNYAIYTNAGNVSIGDELETRAGRIKNTTRVTTTYTILITDEVVFANTDSAGYTVTLPAGAEGQTLKIINSGSSTNNLTVAPDGSEDLIGVNSNFTLSDGESLIITYNATDGWY